MKKLNCIERVILLACILLSTISNAEVRRQKIDSVSISGSINVHGVTNRSTASFYVNDPVLGRSLSYYSVIDNTGVFKVKFLIRNAQDIFWSYTDSSIFRLIVSPGDSLVINVKDTIFSFEGDGAKTNEDIHLMWELYAKKFPSQEQQRATGLEPEEYLIFQQRMNEKQMQFLSAFCSERSCTERFKQWYTIDREVDYYRFLFSYGWRSLKYGLGSNQRLDVERAKKYLNSFMNASDTGVHQFHRLSEKRFAQSSNYMSLINDLSNHLIQYKKLQETYLAEKIDYLQTKSLSASEYYFLQGIKTSYKEERDIEPAKSDEYFKIAHRYQIAVDSLMSNRYVDFIISETRKIERRNLRNLILCQRFCNYLQYNENTEYFYKSVVREIDDQDLINALAVEYNEVKKFEAETANLSDKGSSETIIAPENNDGRSGEELLKSIVRAYKGKIILLDFWATWCGPCRSDFAKAAELKNSAPFTDVEFVYLCAKSSENTWMNLIKRYQLKGSHYFLTEKQYIDLEKRLKLNGFPSYFLIDKESKFHRVISISDKQLGDQIKTLLNK